MRILVLTGQPREPDNHLLWEGLHEFAEIDLHYIAKDEQRHLRKILGRFDLCTYDRVVLDLLFRHVSRHARLLRTISGLVIYEEDACQEFIPSSRWRGKFSAFYRKIPHARIIMTGKHVSDQFRAQGIDAHFLPKGYDSTKLYNEHIPRDIELGFIGRIASDAYQERREFLEQIARELNVQLLRTAPGDEYRQTLNRIQIFVSADIGLGEYMAKNFEAMACGCLLLAYRQGNGEEEALGLFANENVLLYGDREEIQSTLTEILADKDKILAIARAGQEFAIDQMDYAKLAKRLYVHIQPPTRPVPSVSAWSQLIAPIRRLFHLKHD